MNQFIHDNNRLCRHCDISFAQDLRAEVLKGLLFLPYSPALTVHSGVDLVLSQALSPLSAVWI